MAARRLDNPDHSRRLAAGAPKTCRSRTFYSAVREQRIHTSFPLAGTFTFVPADDPVLDELSARLSAIYRSADASPDLKDIEPLLADLLRFFQDHPDSRPDFEAVLCSLVQVP